MIPGSNLLAMAGRVITPQSFTYYQFISRSTTPAGKLNPLYAAGVPMTGTVQPIPRTLYAAMGLDFQKTFYNFFVQQGIIDIKRDVSGDQFVWNYKNFQCVSRTSWHAIDGWDMVLCAQVPGF